MNRKVKLPEGTFVCIAKESLPRLLKREVMVWDFLILGEPEEDSNYLPLCELKEITIPSDAELTRAGMAHVKVMEAKASAAFSEAKSIINNYRSALLLLEDSGAKEASDD